MRGDASHSEVYVLTKIEDYLSEFFSRVVNACAYEVRTEGNLAPRAT